jgi:hypothetical protein
MTEAERDKAVHDACGQIVEAFRNPEDLPKALAPVFLNLGTWMSKWSPRNQLIAYANQAEDAMTIYNWERYAGRKPLQEFLDQQEALDYVPGGFLILKPVKVPVWITVRDENDEPKRVKRHKIIGYTPHYVYPKHNTEIVDPDKAAEWDERNEKARRVIDEMPFIDMLRAKGIKFRVEDTASYGILGYYNPRDQVIALGVENMATALHEVGHHYDPARVDGAGQDPGNEMVAELFGATLLTMLGFEHEADLGGAWEYIRAYATDKSGDTSTVAILGAVSDIMWRVKAALNTFFEDVKVYEEAA